MGASEEPDPPTGALASSGVWSAVTFGAGDSVAQRYRVVRFIARGGMGEVYEAEDLELEEHVALARDPRRRRPGMDQSGQKKAFGFRPRRPADDDECREF